jgi:rhodanese-related sulfurtransferase
VTVAAVGFGWQAGLVVGLVAFAVFLLVTRLMNRGGADRRAEVEVALGAGAVVVDVRSPAEFAQGHVPGALNLPVDGLAGRLAELPAERMVVVYCASGARSARAAALLRGAGRTVVDAGTAASFPTVAS